MSDEPLTGRPSGEPGRTPPAPTPEHAAPTPEHPAPAPEPPAPAPHLSAALRGLAESSRTPAPGTGAQVRRRAQVRGRRRRAVVAGGVAVAVGALVFGLAAGLGGEDGSGPTPPAAPPSPTASATAPAVGVDLAARTLTVRGRTLPVSSGTASHPTKPGRMTVVAKHRTKRLSGTAVGLGNAYDLTLPWVVELRDSGGRTNYLVALTYDDGAPGTRDITRGMLGLRPGDAKWLYEQVGPGSVVTIEGTAPTA
ncbi:L,D-transpeptidase [Streptomyces aureocirculatus]|uniref:L,D-transpeptidase n=1 Tax=Streptomyces aureocirculatus TaxID=67275 RepID=UPI00099C9842|nr:L,D-transpeptidase [Streptomyces aureocirculatus]